MAHLSLKEVPRYIDISAVRTDVTYDEVRKIAHYARKYNFICAFVMPCFTPMLKKELADCPTVKVGGVVGFPSGADTTSVKLQAAREAVAWGCDEIDMVINVGALMSGDVDLVRNEVKAVKEVVGDTPLKAILEVSCLTDEEIKAGAKAAMEGGVTFVKSGTGWKNATTLKHIQLMKEAVGDKCLIKAAGGVRDLATMEAMVDAGCTRFGISLKSALNILKEASEREGVPFED